MILVAGGTGTLGTQVLRLLTGRELQVRVLTRDPRRVQHHEGARVEVARVDVRDRQAVGQAVNGVQTVISAIQGFAGAGNPSPRTVDGQGNSMLIQAAREAGVQHFILMSVHGASPDHPMELFRMKYAAEQELRRSGLAWTIIRATAFMETWSKLLGEPLLNSGKTRVFGRGTNPINFVSAHDVARFVELAVIDPAMQSSTVDVGGPQNLSMRQFAETFKTVAGNAGAINSVPLPIMRLMAVLLRPIKPAVARQIQAGVVMDTHDMTFDPSETSRRYPSAPLTTLAEVVRRDYSSLDAVLAMSPVPEGER